MKVKKLLAAILALAMTLGMMGVPTFAATVDVWDGTVSTAWYGEGTDSRCV